MDGSGRSLSRKAPDTADSTSRVRLVSVYVCSGGTCVSGVCSNRDNTLTCAHVADTGVLCAYVVLFVGLLNWVCVCVCVAAVWRSLFRVCVADSTLIAPPPPKLSLSLSLASEHV